MNKSDIEDLIKKRTAEGSKSYSFNNDHNPSLPADYWFQNAQEGETLFIVFYTQACRWAKCLGCNLPSQMSQYPIHFTSIMKQIDFIFDYLLDEKKKVSLKKFIISNNGSVLDEDTFSTTALIYFMAKMNMHCPNVSTLTIETRPEYVDLEELEILARALKEGATPTTLELAIGFEAYDEKIRNDHFLKGLSLEVFEKLASMMSKYGFRLKCYFMVKPVPGMSEEEAVNDVKQGIEYISSVAERCDVDINMHLNPTYVAKGTVLEERFNEGEYSPPLLESVRKALLTAEGRKLSIFVGLNDEGLAVPGGSFIREGDEELIAKLDKFNMTQDYELLK